LLAGWITAQSENVANSGCGIAAENLGDLLLGVADTGEVRDRRNRGAGFDA
jgi:hypothetical protein